MARRRYSKNKVQQTNHLLLFWVIVLVVVVMSVTQTTSLIELTGLFVAIILAVGLTVIGVSYIIQQRRSQKRLQALRLLRLDDVDRMSGIQFEKYVAELLKYQGYSVKTTPVSGDYGVDLVITRNKVRTAVQLKCYSKAVAQEAVREAFSGMAHYRCTKSMVITNNQFTPHAKALAASNKCELVDRDQLALWILDFYQAP
ncbi:restriction endonuclease [Patescibacteria group bacterium]|nr:MAG: restriction endonuclease [Patescibacteria group bacterium]